MNSYLARLELHGADSAHYELLHHLMEQIGFHRTMRADSGIDYKLPEAYYCKRDTFDNQYVAREQICAVAAQTGLQFELVLSDFNLALFYNLEPVSTAANDAGWLAQYGLGLNR